MNVKLLVFLSLSVFTSVTLAGSKPANAQWQEPLMEGEQWIQQNCWPPEKCPNALRSVWDFGQNQWNNYQRSQRPDHDSAKGNSSNIWPNQIEQEVNRQHRNWWD